VSSQYGRRDEACPVSTGGRGGGRAGTTRASRASCSPSTLATTVPSSCATRAASRRPASSPLSLAACRPPAPHHAPAPRPPGAHARPARPRGLCVPRGSGMTSPLPGGSGVPPPLLLPLPVSLLYTPSLPPFLRGVATLSFARSTSSWSSAASRPRDSSTTCAGARRSAPAHSRMAHRGTPIVRNHRGTRRVRLVRGEGRGVSTWYGGEGGGGAECQLSERRSTGPAQGGRRARGLAGRSGARGAPSARGCGSALRTRGAGRPTAHAPAPAPSPAAPARSPAGSPAGGPPPPGGARAQASDRAAARRHCAPGPSWPRLNRSNPVKSQGGQKRSTPSQPQTSREARHLALQELDALL